MLKLNKKYISTLLLVCIFLMGCSVKVDAPHQDIDQKQIDIVDYEPMGKTIYAPVSISYVIENPIEITTIDVSEDSNHQRSYFEISGLIDKTVEENINAAIKELFYQMLPYMTGEKLPPYRGIETAIDKDRKMYHSALTVTPQFNANNVLSISGHIWVNYSHIYNYSYFAVNEALNYDLNTGKLLSIEDVFTNDAKGLEIVNKAIMGELNRRRLFTYGNDDDWLDLALVYPFKGIDSNQKFYLTYDGLYVIIDYDNPEFNIGFSPALVMIPFYTEKEYIAITERFYNNEHTIFTKEPRNKRFLRDHHLNRTYQRDSYTKDGASWHVFVSYPEGIRQTFLDIINKMKIEQERMASIIAPMPPLVFVEQNIYADRMGPYVNMNSYLYVQGETDGRGQEIKRVYLEDGEPVALKDLFVEDYDYRSLIMGAMEQTIRQYGWPGGLGREIDLEDLMFTINDSYMFFSTKVDEENPSAEQLHFHINYEEIGIENLRIFDHD